MLAFIVLVLNEMVLVLDSVYSITSTSTASLSTASLSTSTAKSDAKHEQSFNPQPTARKSLFWLLSYSYSMKWYSYSIPYFRLRVRVPLR
jgi:hypothetical protein